MMPGRQTRWRALKRGEWRQLAMSPALFFGLALSAGADRVRPPAVQGMFYPGSERELRADLATRFEQCRKQDVKGPLRALICPHAGYRYSAVVAAAGYRLVGPQFKRVIVLAPAHRYPLQHCSIPEVDAYSNCLGRIPLDPAAAALRDRWPFIGAVAAAHAQEHALEVQLPFLQTRLDSFTLIPIVVGRQDPEELANALLPLLNDETLLVASSDLSHYHPYDMARERDLKLIDTIREMRVEDTARGEACGVLPICTVMYVARRLGWQPTVLDYRNSGDTTGTKDRVVGYASIAFTGKPVSPELKSAPPPPTESAQLRPEDQAFLLALARLQIQAALLRREPTVTLPADAPYLAAEGACFVTLTKDGQLRGCIGSLRARQPLVDDVRENALNAAFRDPRFPALKQEELDQIRIEISVLTEPKPLAFDGPDELLKKLRPGVDGVVLVDGAHRSTYLPQVWEQLPRPKQFLSRLCLKGGMPAERWREPGLEVLTYQVVKFREPEKGGKP